MRRCPYCSTVALNDESIYNCSCNVHHSQRNHGDKVKLRLQFCKWEGREKLES